MPPVQDGTAIPPEELAKVANVFAVGNNSFSPIRCDTSIDADVDDQNDHYMTDILDIHYVDANTIPEGINKLKKRSSAGQGPASAIPSTQKGRIRKAAGGTVTIVPTGKKVHRRQCAGANVQGY
jgi:hypothetical protein